MNDSRRKLAALKPLALILAGVLAGSLFSEVLRPSAAVAQTLPPDKVLNSGDKLQQLVVAQNQTNDRLAKIESILTAGLKVKVIEMPPQPKDK